MQADRAGRRLHQPHQQFHKGGFTRPVGADEGHLVPFVDRKAEPVEHLVRFPLDAAVGHRNVLEGGHRLPLRRDGRPRGRAPGLPGGQNTSLPSEMVAGKARHGQAARLAHPPGRKGHLRRENIAALQFFHSLQSLAGGQHPLHPALFQQHDVLAEVGNVLGVVLDDDDGLAVPLVQLPQHPIDAGRRGPGPAGRWARPGSGRRACRRQSPRQCQQMGLPARQLPDEITLPAAQGRTAPTPPMPRSL